MVSFRFETFENLVTKHHLGGSVTWENAARWAVMNKSKEHNTTVCSVKMLDADTVEIVKRKDQNLGFLYRYLGMDQKGLYERVTINRKDRTTAVDRIDGNFWAEHPFMGRRDLFYMESRNEGVSEKLAFVRHDFWLFKLSTFGARMYTTVDSMLYKSAFKSA